MTNITKIVQLPMSEGCFDAFDIDKNGNFAYTVSQSILFTKVVSKISSETIELKGHHSKVTALCFSIAAGNDYLISAGSFYAILWDIGSVWTSHKCNQEIRGRVIAQFDNSPTSDLKSSPNLERICITNKCEVAVYDIESKLMLWSKFGYNCTKTLFLQKSVIVLIIKGCHIEIWNIDDNTEMWRSKNIPNEIEFLWKETSNRFGIGCSNNSMTVYSGSTMSDWKKSFTIDLDMEIFRYKSANADEYSADSQIIEVRAMEKTSDGTSHLSEFDYRYIVCATSQSFFLVNSLTQKVEVLPFSRFDIDFISAVRFAQNPNSSIQCVTVPLFKSHFEVVEIDVGASQENEISITVIPNTPLIENSILKKSLAPSKRPSKNGSKLKRNPLTFHDKIKSSGYNKKHEDRKMFQPVTSSSKGSKPRSTCAKKMELLTDSDVVVNWSQRISITASTKTSDRPSNVNHISISECNRYMSCSLLNSTCVILSRKSQKHVATLRGHDASCTSSSWNYDSTVVLTCSNDYSAKLWNLFKPDQPILNLTLVHGTLSKKFGKFTQGISYGQFYYMDKFLMLSFGNSFGLYSYHIDHGPRDDVKRYLDKNQYKLVSLFNVSEAQSLTCLASPNNIYSYVTLACGSDKTVRVFDMNTASCCGKIENAHTRPVSNLVLNTGSSFAQPVSYDLFFTTAPTDGIKLWDLRSCKCSLRLKSHDENYINPFDVSSNGCYLATSGDDKKIHIYDVRKMEIVQSSAQQKDKVSSLRFSKDAQQIHIGLRTGEITTLSHGA